MYTFFTRGTLTEKRRTLAKDHSGDIQRLAVVAYHQAGDLSITEIQTIAHYCPREQPCLLHPISPNDRNEGY